MDEPDETVIDPDLPVTVIGGYLGSGKTTLVNHVLRRGDERVVVLVNDFGAVDVDADLIDRHDGSTISLANGCICCSLVDGLAAALVSVAAIEPRPDRLVIETSGVADPATVAAHGHGPGLVLDAVVVLVDVETIRARAVDRYVGDTVLRQLASADVVVVNKIDLVDRVEVVAVHDRLGEWAPDAVVVEATGAEVDPAVLFGPHDPAGDIKPQRGRHHRADEVFESWSWAYHGAVERNRLENVMADLPDGVVRVKGVVHVVGQPGQPVILQRVGRRWTMRPLRRGDDGPSRLVLIGHRGAIDDTWLAGRLP